MHTCLSNGSPQVFNRVVLRNLSEKTWEWDLKIFCLTIFVLGSVEAFFLEVSAHVSLRPATTGV